MPVFEFAATINPGQRHNWWTGGGGWYTHDHKPQLDAHPMATFPEGINFTGIHVPLWYGDFGCQIESSTFTGSDMYTYYVSVINKGSQPALYHMRVWVP